MTDRQWKALFLIGSILAAFLLIACFGKVAHAEQEVKVKMGYANIICEPIHPSGVVELSCETRNNVLGLEVFGQILRTSVNDVGDLTYLGYGITPKLYLPRNFYIGFGIGYINNFVPGSMDIDDEVQRYGVIGKDFGSWGVELKRVVADLDIETFLPYEPDIEKHSRLDNWQILVYKKWRL
jgi:hypothetical protein